MANVEWRDVSGYEGRYEVSSDGQVCSHVGLKPRILKQGLARPIPYKMVGLARPGGAGGKGHLVHRLVAFAFLGRPVPDNLDVDHINGDPGDNRVENLRWCTRSQNRANTPVHRKRVRHSSLKGVAKNGKRWSGTIMVHQKRIHLGTFDTEQEAHEAYLAAADKYFGEYANGG